MQFDLGGLVLTAGVQTAIGFVFYMLVQRTVEKVDKLTDQLRELKDKRVTGIEAALQAHSDQNDRRFEGEATSRREIYNRLGIVEKEYVHGIACRTAMREVVDGQAEFRAAVVDLAGARADIRHLAGFLSEVNERTIAAAMDVARLEGRKG